MRLSFRSGKNQLGVLAGSIVIITGAGRSGKSLLGNILGSCQHVEHIDEPWFPMVLPMLAGLGTIDEDLAVQMFQTSVTELLNDRLLMRNANLRPSDMSSIWKQKSPEEIFSRLINLHSRDDVKQHGRDHRPTLVLNLPDTVPFCSLFKKAVPDCHVIHLIRDGIDVALEVREKGWLSNEELSHPNNPLPYRKYTSVPTGQTVYLPCWVEDGSEEQYLSYSELGRGLYYWRRMSNDNDIRTAGFGESKYSIVKYEDLVERPAQTFEGLKTRLNLKSTEITELLLSQLTKPGAGDMPSNVPTGPDIGEISGLKSRYEHLGLPVERVDQLLIRVQALDDNS